MDARQHDSVLAARDVILSALRDEMTRRHEPGHDDWEDRERAAVVYAANIYAREHNKNRTNKAQVEAIEGLAVGHVDYASKLALYVAEQIHGVR
jgi:hypothetical protein